MLDLTRVPSIKSLFASLVSAKYSKQAA
jgi:hypothetical protein